MNIARYSVPITLAALCGGCAVGPDFVRPTPRAPAHWSNQARAAPATRNENTIDEQATQLPGWWNAFNDPTLGSLVERAVASNLDLRVALVRVEESRAQRDISASGLWPTVSTEAAFSRQRLSDTTPTGALFSSVGSIPLPAGAHLSIPNPYNQYQLSADASWEIDLFGRVRRSLEAANANLQVSVEDQRAVRVSVLADVAQNYLELRGSQSRLQIAQQNLATIDDLLGLTRQRLAAGMTTHIDMSNALAQSAQTHAELPAYEMQITQGINRLSQLLGLAPETLRVELDSGAPVPSVPAQVPIGLPADLARRRPDIRQAEASLHAATAQIGVSVADLFPRLTLMASGGVQSETAGNLLEWASRFGSFGPTLTLPVFDRGRWKSVHLNRVRAQEAALNYERTVLGALHEVENALAAYRADQDRRAWLETAVAQNLDALTLSRQRYESGVESFIEVLDVERIWQQNRLALADSTTAVSTDLVHLYRALGGGWQPPVNSPDNSLPDNSL
jgi:NodT family efflux transporter outer membrane factor (OMF) lipoprotein